MTGNGSPEADRLRRNRELAGAVRKDDIARMGALIEAGADLAARDGGDEADRRTVRHRALHQGRDRRTAPCRPLGTERASGGRTRDLDEGRTRKALPPYPRGQGHGLHAQTMGPLRPLPRRTSSLELGSGAEARLSRISRLTHKTTPLRTHSPQRTAYLPLRSSADAYTGSATVRALTSSGQRRRPPPTGSTSTLLRVSTVPNIVKLTSCSNHRR